MTGVVPRQRVLPMGRSALLVECEQPAQWALACSSEGLSGVVDIVPAAETVLVTFATAHQCEVARDRVSKISHARNQVNGGGLVTIEMRYDGIDLADVARAIGRTTHDVVQLHSEALYTVAFCGFAPGFAYLTGLSPALRLPRRMTPRTRVPAGSVAIAAEYTAVYPGESPGGWNLLGSTEQVTWDPARDPPALLQPGTVVRFEAM